MFCKVNSNDIYSAYLDRCKWARKQDFLYGRGNAGIQIADKLSGKSPDVQKLLNF